MEHIMHEREYTMNNMEIFVLCPEKKTSTLTGQEKNHILTYDKNVNGPYMAIFTKC